MSSTAPCGNCILESVKSVALAARGELRNSAVEDIEVPHATLDSLADVVAHQSTSEHVAIDFIVRGSMVGLELDGRKTVPRFSSSPPLILTHPISPIH